MMKKRKNLGKIFLLVSLVIINVLLLGCISVNVIFNSSNVDSQSAEEYALTNNEAQAISNTSNVTVSGNTVTCDSIVQGVRDCDLPSGTYNFVVTGSTNGGTSKETKTYPVELIVFDDDVTYASNVSLGDTTTNARMLVVKYKKNLTINSGVTVTAATASNGLTYKKGMYICVIGKLVNNGTISMTARGTSAAGENVYLWKNNNNTFDYVPASGASGLAKYMPGYPGKAGRVGNNGVNRASGGGGQGGALLNTGNGAQNSYVGASAAGTSYSGGAGSGGIVRCNAGAVTSGAGSITNGGNATVYDSNTKSYYYGGGGAGITGGTGMYSNAARTSTGPRASSGTGGLLILYADNIDNNGQISSNGSSGGGSTMTLSGGRGYYSGAVGGGGSGGGSINVFYNKSTNLGTIVANGGAGGDVSQVKYTAGVGQMGKYNGGKGGDGSVTVINVQSELNYEEKEITIQTGESYNIDKSKISLVSPKNKTRRNDFRRYFI